jgi:hypothetical protein
MSTAEQSRRGFSDVFDLLNQPEPVVNRPLGDFRHRQQVDQPVPEAGAGLERVAELQAGHGGTKSPASSPSLRVNRKVKDTCLLSGGGRRGRVY